MVKTITDKSPVLLGSVPYIVIKEIGQLGDKGKRVMCIGYTGRFIANEQYPFSSLMRAIADELSGFVRWENDEQGRADLAALKEWADSLEIQK